MTFDQKPKGQGRNQKVLEKNCLGQIQSFQQASSRSSEQPRETEAKKETKHVWEKVR